MKHIRRILCVALACLVPACALPAQGRAPGDASGKIPYASGGASAAERTALATRRDDYNLRLVFGVHDSNAMVANVALTVDDVRRGRVFALQGSGPLVFLKVPPGTYTVVATSRGVEQRRRVTVDVAGGARDLYFYWIRERAPTRP
ncbi:hypothetical protein [Pseudoduganella lutea]|uniref:Carboxypeptidase regulatory-like domain-containing protein n=1 Tax=Pseudoduganella lutea TaxID=321985 RepID=A0A4P6KUI4_9BURK|nr:hypothetical protein [Pseudoduganella lutea]QBE61748.1 hypothetical protein EWM63_00990 [Pseudoduganella lutea]